MGQPEIQSGPQKNRLASRRTVLFFRLPLGVEPDGSLKIRFQAAFYNAASRALP